MIGLEVTNLDQHPTPNISTLFHEIADSQMVFQNVPGSKNLWWPN